jgi:exopolysaccharide biosynthesis protein
MRSHRLFGALLPVLLLLSTCAVLSHAATVTKTIAKTTITKVTTKTIAKTTVTNTKTIAKTTITKTSTKTIAKTTVTKTPARTTVTTTLPKSTITRTVQATQISTTTRTVSLPPSTTTQLQTVVQTAQDPLATELVVNGGFQQDQASPIGWQVQDKDEHWQVRIVTENGQNLLDVDAFSVGQSGQPAPVVSKLRVTQPISLTLGKAYLLSAWVFLEQIGGADKCTLEIG